MIHLPFADRVQAGQLLAREISRQIQSQNAAILGLARGGVPVAVAVARQLCLPLDVIVARKLGVPWQPELAMGAIAGTARILNGGMIAHLKISPRDVDNVTRREQAEMQRREDLYRSGRAVAKLRSQTVMLVDDGLATGSTMIAAVHYVRSHKPASVIVAVPVASREVVDRLRGEADEVVCLAIPTFFNVVSEWYRDSSQVSDDEVRNLLTSGPRQDQPPE
jgi:putative phosphoribosyl transferase